MLVAIITGIIQGITEFLPISSSGHLLILHNYLGDIENSLALDAVLHMATAFSLLIYFRKEWLQIILNWRKDIRLQYIIVGSLPAVLLGIMLEGYIESYLRSPWVVVIMLTLVGFVMLFESRLWSETDSVEELAMEDVVLIGAFQAMALIPGTSRSGITILAGLSQGLSRKQAARFAFLLGMPLTLGAGLVKLPDLIRADINITFVSVAFLIAFLAGIVAIAWLLKYLETRSLKLFAIYRFLLSLAILTALI